MDIRVSPATLGGSLPAIPSKSDAHRLLICAALADKKTELRLPSSSEDIDATCRCLTALGADISRCGEFLTVTPISTVPPSPVLDCGESGSTLRFMLPVAAAVAPKAKFTGRGRLPERPLEDLVSEMEKHGVAFSSHKLPFEISGTLSGGTYELAGNVSSQYITGLLLGLSAAGKSAQIRLTTELESSAYVDITLNALSKFGISIQRTEFGWTVPENQNFRSPEKLPVDGDWSNSAFFLAAGTSGSGITVTGLDTNSPQGDKSILKVFSDFGAETKITQNGVRILPSNLHGCTVDMRQIPDALPILAVLAATAEGQTHFVNAARLRLKESDRIATTAAMLRSLGIKTEEEPDGLTVFKGRFSGGIVDGAGDHRIVMAAAIAACNSTENVIIKGAEAVNKSYPSFFNDLKYLGGIANVI